MADNQNKQPDLTPEEQRDLARRSNSKKSDSGRIHMKTYRILAVVLLMAVNCAAQSGSTCYQGTDTDQGPPLHFMKQVPCETLSGEQSHDQNFSVLPELPDTPQPQPKPHYMKFADINSNIPLRTNRQTLKDPAWYVPQIAAWTLVSVDVAINRHSPSAPHGADLYVDAFVPALLVTGMSYLSHRYLWAPMGSGLTAYMASLHFKGIMTGRYP